MKVKVVVASVVAALAIAAVWIAPSEAMQARADSRDPWQVMNVPLQTQDGTRVRFYDDLVKGKIVLINFIFTSCTSECPRTTANLVRVQEALGNHLGRDIRMISVTVDPATDSPPVLKKYSVTYGTKPGWYFVTGRQKDVDVIRRRLGVLDDSVSRTQHTGMLVYGNESTGQWAATPAMAQPGAIVRSVMRLVNLQRDGGTS
jgi:protein SCO1/2